MAFGLMRSKIKRNILVFDFGGTFLEISILSNNNVHYKYTVEYTRVLLNHGGRLVTEKIVDFCIEMIRTNFDLLEEDEAGVRKDLHGRCEYAKRFLSSNESTVIKSRLEGKHDLDIELTRQDLERIADPIFN